MYTQQINIDYSNSTVDEELTNEYISFFINSLMNNGQILGEYTPCYQHNNCLSVIVMTPEQSSLESHNTHYHVEKNIGRLAEHKITFNYQTLGIDPTGSEYCQCCKPSAYIMYTLDTSVESPIRCADCFYPVPLYKLPPFKDHDYRPLISWQADFNCCDQLQMRCWTLEKAGTREMSKLDSNLTKQGLICRDILATNTKSPVYYYLYNYSAHSLKQERAKKCPSCNRDWILKEEWHDTFAFRCDHCYLVSNFSFVLNSQLKTLTP